MVFTSWGSACKTRLLNTLQLLNSCSVYLLVETKPFDRESKDNNRRIIHSEQR